MKQSSHFLISSHVVLIFLFTFQQVTSTWWFLSQVQISAVGSAGGGTAVCDLVPGLSRRQRRICLQNPDVMAFVGEGAKRGVTECQHQFATQRWNCTTIDRAGIGKIMLKLGSREAAFVYAISSAGVVHSIARGCARGEIRSCSCDGGRRGVARDSQGNVFNWGGCSDNIRYANSFARKFIDAKERMSRDGSALMNLHNNRAGRKAVRRKMRLQCKCHGVSGSCTTRTCWNAVPDFDEIGEQLLQKYKKAMQVTVNPEGASLLPSNRLLTSARRHDSPLPSEDTASGAFPSGRRRSPIGRKKPKKIIQGSELVFFEPSPDYCVHDPRIVSGSLGTAGRQCNKTSTGPDSCDLLCCGRGHDTKRVIETEKCECKFIWCCRVECKSCSRVVDIHTCKAAGSSESPAASSFRPSLPASAGAANSTFRSEEQIQTQRRLISPDRYEYRIGSRKRY